MPLGSGLELIVHIVGDDSKLGTTLAGADSKIAGFGKNISDTNTRLGAIVAVGKKAAGVTVDMAKAGKDAALAEQQFADALTAAGVATDGWQAKTDAAILSAQKLGFTDDDARNAIQTLATTTGDLETALGLLPGVMDVAAKGQTDMASASDAVSKALNGNELSLSRMVDDYSALAEGQTRVDSAFALNASAAENWAATTEGTASRVNIAMSEVSENIGGTFVQAFQKIKEALDPLLDSLRPFLEAVRELLTAIMPFLNPLLESMGKALGRVADALSRIVNFATRVLEFFTSLLGKLQEVADKIANIMPDFDKLKNFDITPGDRIGRNSAGTGSEPVGSTRAVSGGTGATAWAPFTINIYGNTAEIEARVKNAIRSYNRRNGPGAILLPGRS